MWPGTRENDDRNGDRPQGSNNTAPGADVPVLTFGNGERRVGEVESHQLCRELAQEAAGHRAIEERALIAHDVHQGDGLGGVGCAHNLN